MIEFVISGIVFVAIVVLGSIFCGMCRKQEMTMGGRPMKNPNAVPKSRYTGHHGFDTAINNDMNSNSNMPSTDAEWGRCSHGGGGDSSCGRDSGSGSASTTD